MKRFFTLRAFAVCFLASSLVALVFVETQEAEAVVLTLVKPFNGVVNKAVSSAVGKRLNTMGFAANDPIYGATMTASRLVVGGAIVAGSIASTVAAVGSAPVWLSVALGLGAAYEVYDFAFGDSVMHFDGNAVSVKPDLASVSAPAPEAYPATEYQVPPSVFPIDYLNPGVGNSVTFPSDLPMCATFSHTVPDFGGSYIGIASPVAQAASGVVCGKTAEQIRDLAAIFYQQAVIQRTNSDNLPTDSLALTGIALISTTGPTKVSCTVNALNCPQGVRYSYNRSSQVTMDYFSYGAHENVLGTVSFNYQIFANPYFIDSTRTYSVNDAAARLTDADKNSLADPALLAALASKIWQAAAAAPGYEGAPYDVQNPVTAAEILADVAAGLYPHPTVGDLLALPALNPQTAPEFDPTAVPVVEPAAGAETVTVDLGVDPGIVSPTLEPTPTGSAVVGHIMGLLPSMSEFSMPAHTSECSAPEFNFFGQVQSMSSMCDLLEGQRVLLSTIFSAVWGVFALTMVLRA